MLKYILALPLLFVLSINSHATELVLDQQAMFYIDVAFDVDQAPRAQSSFGFRLDNGLVAPGENMTAIQLVQKPAIFNLKLDHNGLRRLELSGIDYSSQIHHATDQDDHSEPQTQAKTDPAETTETVEKIDIPLGVIIGISIGLVAIATGGS